MKRLLLAATVITIIACNKNNSHTGTIVRIQPTATTALLSAPTLDSVLNYFSKNSISTTNLQPAGFVTAYADILGANGQPYHGIYHLVWCNQYENGLPILSSNSTPNIYFDSTGALLPNDNYGYTGSNPGSDTAARQTLDHLRTIFLTTIRNAKVPGASIGPLYDPYSDSALQATLGYADVAMLANGGTSNKNLRKVWLVSLADNKNPSIGGMFIDDASDETWFWH